MLADAIVDFLASNGTLILTGLGAGVAGVGAFVGYMVKTVWKRIDHYWERRDKREESLNFKQSLLIDSIAENAPKQTTLLSRLEETQRAIASDIAESRKRDSDFIREVHQTKEAAIELSYGIESLAVEEIEKRREDVKRYTGRARQRLGVRKESEP